MHYWGGYPKYSVSDYYTHVGTVYNGCNHLLVTSQTTEFSKD